MRQLSRRRPTQPHQRCFAELCRSLDQGGASRRRWPGVSASLRPWRPRSAHAGPRLEAEQIIRRQWHAVWGARGQLPHRLIVQLPATASRAACGRRMRSAAPTLDPATAHQDPAAIRKMAGGQQSGGRSPSRYPGRGQADLLGPTRTSHSSSGHSRAAAASAIATSSKSGSTNSGAMSSESGSKDSE